MLPFFGGYHDPEALRRGMKVLAILDSILSSRPELRYHTYVAKHLPGVDLGVVENGAGDDMFCFFSEEHGTIIKGFDHESPMSPHAFAIGRNDFRPWPGIYEEVPPELLQYLEPAEFHKVEATFCIWRRRDDSKWWQGDIDWPPDGNDGSAFLLGTIYLDAESYLDWARDYYSNVVAEEPVREVYLSGRVSRSAALAINPAVNVNRLEQELAVIGEKLAER